MSLRDVSNRTAFDLVKPVFSSNFNLDNFCEVDSASIMACSSSVMFILDSTTGNPTSIELLKMLNSGYDKLSSYAALSLLIPEPNISI